MLRGDAQQLAAVGHFFVERAAAPRWDPSALPWPAGGAAPAALCPDDADTNCPGYVDWARAEAALAAALAAARADSAAGGACAGWRAVVVVVGFLLLSEPAAALAARVQRWVVLTTDAAADEALWRRKWTRRKAVASTDSEPGQQGQRVERPSYEQCGVSAAEFRVFYEGHVRARWREHGEGRPPPQGAPLLEVSCMLPTADAVSDVLEFLGLEKQPSPLEQSAVRLPPMV